MRSENEIATVVGVSDDAWMDLLLHEWEALPLPIRVQNRLAEILVMLDELRAEFRNDAPCTLRWVDVEVETIGDTVASLLDRLAC